MAEVAIGSMKALDLSFIQRLQDAFEYRSSLNLDLTDQDQCTKPALDDDPTAVLLPTDQEIYQEALQAFDAGGMAVEVQGQLLTVSEIDVKLGQVCKTVDTNIDSVSTLSSRTADVLCQHFPDWRGLQPAEILNTARSNCSQTLAKTPAACFGGLRLYGSPESLELARARPTEPAGSESSMASSTRGGDVAGPNILKATESSSPNPAKSQSNLAKHPGDDSKQGLCGNHRAIRICLLPTEGRVTLLMTDGSHGNDAMEANEEERRAHSPESASNPACQDFGRAKQNGLSSARLTISSNEATTTATGRSELLSRQDADLLTDAGCHHSFQVHQFFKGQRDYLTEIRTQKLYWQLEMELNRALAHLRMDELMYCSLPETM